MSNTYTSLGLIISQLTELVPDSELETIAHNAEHAIESMSDMIYHTARASIECDDLHEHAYRDLCESVMTAVEVQASMRKLILAADYVSKGLPNPYRKD